MRKFLAIALFASSFGAAFAADMPVQIKKAVDGGMKVVKEFDGPSGLKGWVIGKGNHNVMVFTTHDGKTLIEGLLVGSDGANLSEYYAKKYVPKPDYSKEYESLTKAASITTGSTNPKSTIYAFFDPNCIFCHLLWKELKPYEKAGLRTIWVPVAFLKPSSVGIGAAILEAKNPAAAFERNEEKFVEKTETGGIKPLAKPGAKTLNSLKANTMLMAQFGQGGTPLIVWKDKDGKIQTAEGLPKLSSLPAITGLPEQVESDPELNRFK